MHRIARPEIEIASIICQSGSIRAVYGGMLAMGKNQAGRARSLIVLVDNDCGRHSSPIVIGAARSEQSGVMCNKIDVGCLFWLQEDRSPTLVERVGIFNLHRGEKIG